VISRVPSLRISGDASLGLIGVGHSLAAGPLLRQQDPSASMGTNPAVEPVRLDALIVGAPYADCHPPLCL
jgi:hypothetical protein